MHFLQYVHWDPDPSIFGLPFRWYGLLFASSFFFGYFIMRRVLRMENLPDHWLESLTIYMAVSTVVGARLGHCLFYDPGYYLSHPIEILKIWEGGLASHGAAIGIITGLILWSRRVSRRSPLWVLDRIVIMVALSGLTIRAGNLMNSEILGKETTASYGFVFPRADQSSVLRAKWEGEKVQLAYQPEGIAYPRQFEFFRTSDDHKVTQLAGNAIVPKGDLRQPINLVDAAPGSRGAIHYIAAETGAKAPLTVSNGDSLHPRTASFADPFAADKAVFGGIWEGEKVHLRFDMRGLVGGTTTRGTLLLRGDGTSKDWEVIHRGVIGGNSATMVLDTLDLPTGIANPVYRLLVKEDETLLVARHPAQIYEAVAYTIIFVLLLWLYFRRKGVIPMGEFFGYFLILVFTMRFLIEFGKEEQAEFMMGFPLNMGQLLSIPFVLAGVYFVWRAKAKPKFPEPVPQSAFVENKKRDDKK